MPISLRTLCLVTLVLCNIPDSLEHEIPRRSFLSRRAIDGTRGRKYFDPEEEGAFDSYGSAGGQYDPYEEKTDLSDIRRNVPGEPGVDYPAYTTLPQTGFTCDGRSRGYYADEVAGCQVFHVCHDVLVSSFLCPIGSIFSQKLLTCDWWTKVDCSSSGKYIDVNRNSYQQDDDEMIRNAYAMISLQSGTDVTKDGLVDPDRTGSVVDYQRGPGRNLDYSSVDPTGNDLRSNYDDYSSAVSRNFLPPYRPKDRKLETSRSYQERFYPSEKSRSPYEDSPIIRVQNIKAPDYRDQNRNRDFQESYHRPNEFTNQFQPSYAPTVPTVTTTTRRFYSPTVPTTFRPSTLAYNKLDQVIDSSDYYFSHSRAKGFVTPPTRSFGNDKRKNSDKPEDLPRKVNDYQQDSYEDDYEDSEERQAPSGERFQVRVAEDYRLNRTGALFDQVYRGFRTREEDEILEDIETRGSIGLGHALSNSFRGISVQQQNPVNSEVKEEEIKQHTLTRPESTISVKEQREETTEQYQRNDQRDQGIVKHREEVDSVPSTTPSVIESTIKATTNLHELSSGIPIDSKRNYSDGNVEVDQKHSIDRVDKFLRPPEESRSKFQINVPDLTDVSTLLIRYSTVDDGPSRTGSTESSRFQDVYSDDYVDHPADEETGPNYPTEDKHFVSHTGSRLPSSSEQKTTVPYRDVSSSVVNYSESLSGSSGLEGSLANRYQSDPIHVSNNTRVTIDSRLQDSLPNFNAKKTCFSENCEKNAEGQISTLGTSGSPESTTDINRFAETLTPRPNEEIRTSPVTKSPIIESSGTTTKPIVHRNTEDVETSTLIKGIRPETLKQIEESIEKNNSPYHVTLTVNQGEELAPTAGDLIGKLIAQQGKESSTVDDKLHQLEIIKSVEPEIVTTDPPVTTVDADHRPNTENGFSKVEHSSRNTNLNTVSLLQLMSELLKLDRAPRPFSLPGAHSSLPRSQPKIPGSSASKTIAKEVNRDMQLQGVVTGKFQENFTETVLRSDPRPKDQFTEYFGGSLPQKDEGHLEFSREDKTDFQKERHQEITSSGAIVIDPRATDHIKDQLSQNFGEPLLKTDEGHLELPRSDTIINFHKDLADSSRDKHHESSFRTTVSDLELKDRIKDRLSQNFGEPLLKADEGHLELPRSDTIINFHKDLADSNRDKHQESNFRTTVADLELKDRIKDQLSQNFGEPLLKTDQGHLELPRKDTITDFDDRLPATNKSKQQESTNFRTTIGSSVPVSSRSSSGPSTIVSTTPVPQTPTTDSAKTVVKTEFVPSIGFSFDTDEGREEYVEAVLGGLIEPEAAESEKKEDVLPKTTQETLSKKNETLKDA